MRPHTKRRLSGRRRACLYQGRNSRSRVARARGLRRPRRPPTSARCSRASGAARAAARSALGSPAFGCRQERVEEVLPKRCARWIARMHRIRVARPKAVERQHLFDEDPPMRVFVVEEVLVRAMDDPKPRAEQREHAERKRDRDLARSVVALVATPRDRATRCPRCVLRARSTTARPRARLRRVPGSRTRPPVKKNACAGATRLTRPTPSARPSSASKVSGPMSHFRQRQ